jgi:ribosomal protein S18 acetylase RimI-like enzyme
MVAFTTRGAGEADRSFIFATYRETVGPYVEQVWGWDEEFQQRGFWDSLPLTQFKVILVDGVRAGAVHYVENADEYFVGMLLLLPQLQRRGIGTKWLRDLMILAKDAKKPVRLRVMKVNPAKSLYKRLGFKVASEEADFIEMRAV